MNVFVSVSGGLDSTALAILISKECPNAGYIFADTGDEFPQVYDHLKKMESELKIKITIIKSKYDTLREYELKQEFFPTPKARFCTRLFKILPIEGFLKKYEPYQLAVGLRYDEQRGNNPDKHIIYPLIENKIRKMDVYNICKQYNLIPEYPFYMSRGGCYSCFFKKKSELIGLARHEPGLFNELIEREEKVNCSNDREKYFHMFQQFGMPLRKVKEIIDAGEQLEIFDDVTMAYEHTDCGMYCRK